MMSLPKLESRRNATLLRCRRCLSPSSSETTKRTALLPYWSTSTRATGEWASHWPPAVGKLYPPTNTPAELAIANIPPQVVFTELISRLLHPTRPTEATRTLILAHRTELVQQAYAQCRRNYPTASIDIEMGKVHASGTADITVASVASITSSDRISKFDPDTFKLILIDEAHHAVSPRYLRTLDHFGVLNMEGKDHAEKPVLVGVSATLSRFDGLALSKILDHIVYHRGYVEMIEDNWLSPVKFTTVKTNVDLSRVRSTGGDFTIGDLAAVVNTEQANEVTVRSWMHKAASRKSTIVFCVDIAHVNEITAKFRQLGVDARMVTSNTKPAERTQRLEAFKKGEYKVLVNCGVFTEGTDIPNIDCVLLARPTKSRNLLVQMIGRGMRLSAVTGKEDCLVIDMVGNVQRGVVTVPTLLGLDPDEILDEDTLETARARIAERMVDQPNAVAATPPIQFKINNPAVSFTDYETIGELISDTRSDMRIRSISSLAWVNVANSYILNTINGYIKIAPAEGGVFTVTQTRKVPRELYSVGLARPKVVLEGVPLDMAIRAADTLALSKFPRNLLISSAPWRSRLATEEQSRLLSNVEGLDLSRLTKGSAMDMITRMKHGGVARFGEAMKLRKRREKEELRIVSKEMRETVGVGAVGVDQERINQAVRERMAKEDLEKLKAHNEEVAQLRLEHRKQNESGIWTQEQLMLGLTSKQKKAARNGGLGRNII